MTWWAWAWIALVAALTLGGAWDDWRESRVRRATGGLALGVLCVLCIVAFFSDQIASALGAWLLPLALAAGVGTTVEYYAEVRDLVADGETSDGLLRTATIAVALALGGAVAAGVVRGLESW
jgi:hypothetical protein